MSFLGLFGVGARNGGGRQEGEDVFHLMYARRVARRRQKMSKEFTKRIPNSHTNIHFFKKKSDAAKKNSNAQTGELVKIVETHLGFD